MLINTSILNDMVNTAVLTYRLTGTDALIQERFKATERDALQVRIDAIRPYQSKDAKGNWVTGKFDVDGLVDYMYVSFEKPSNKPAFSITCAKSN